jgi:hypothetical protein
MASKSSKNPAEPFYGEIEFDLEEDLSIGEASNEPGSQHFYCIYCTLMVY